MVKLRVVVPWQGELGAFVRTLGHMGFIRLNFKIPWCTSRGCRVQNLEPWVKPSMGFCYAKKKFVGAFGTKYVWVSCWQGGGSTPPPPFNPPPPLSSAPILPGGGGGALRFGGAGRCRTIGHQFASVRPPTTLQPCCTRPNLLHIWWGGGRGSTPPPPPAHKHVFQHPVYNYVFGGRLHGALCAR